MNVRSTLALCLAACGGGAATTATSTPAGRGGSACLEPRALTAPGRRDHAQGVRAGVVCDDGDCTLTVSRDAVTRSHPIDHPPDRHEVGVRQDDLDGDGDDELVVLLTSINAYGPSGEMEIIERTLRVLDATRLELRWSAPAWSSTPPEEQSVACTSDAELRDDDCDGRRETMIQVRRCDAPMCAAMRAGQPEGNDFVRDECTARAPAEERLSFRAGQAGAPFTAAGD